MNAAVTTPTPPKKRASKLGAQPVLDLISKMVQGGESLSTIVDTLAVGGPEWAPVSVSASAVHKRIKEMGLQLQFQRVPAAVEPPSPEAIEAARREMDPKLARSLIKKAAHRNPAWLLSFESDIRSALAESDSNLAQVWDQLALQFGKISPQLSRPLTNHEKTRLIFSFISREAVKAKRKNKMNWARTYLEVGRHALTPALPAGVGASFRSAMTEQPQRINDKPALEIQPKIKQDAPPPNINTSMLPPKRVLGARSSYSSGIEDPEALLRAEHGDHAK